MKGFNLVKYNPDLLKSVLLLGLAVSGNFVGETLGCKTQFHMSNNMIVKHVVLLCIIYFTLNFVSEQNEDPTQLVMNALLIWGSFLVFTKQNINFTMVSAILIMATYVLDSYAQYYAGEMKKASASAEMEMEEEEGEEEMEEAEVEAMTDLGSLAKQHQQFVTWRNYAFNAAIAVTAIGFLMYLQEKRIEYGSNFNFITFLFGKVKCDSLK